jgi:hypothetical protein
MDAGYPRLRPMYPFQPASPPSLTQMLHRYDIHLAAQYTPRRENLDAKLTLSTTRKERTRILSSPPEQYRTKIKEEKGYQSGRYRNEARASSPLGSNEVSAAGQLLVGSGIRIRNSSPQGYGHVKRNYLVRIQEPCSWKQCPVGRVELRKRGWNHGSILNISPSFRHFHRWRPQHHPRRLD